MKILVLGASGLLGRGICNLFDEKEISYIGTYHKNKIDKENFYYFDFVNIDTLNLLVKKHNPTIIINCIVNRIVDECENNWDDIKKINIDFISKLILYNVKIIHISTDYVFDGKNAPYLPDSIVNPIQNYGISKYMAELRILNGCQNYLILRVPVLFTEKYENINESAVTTIAKQIMDLTLTNKIIYEDNYSIRRPVYIPIFCNFILDSILFDYKGIYHFYNPYNKYTKFEILSKISKITGQSIKHILPKYEIGNRPYDTQLIDSKYDIVKYWKDFCFDDVLKKCFSKFYHSRTFEDCFLLIDLDGTLVDSETQHYESYIECMQIDRGEFDEKIQLNTFEYSKDIKDKKNSIFKEKIKNIKLMKNADIFIKYIASKNINHAVVTNTSRINVELYKEYVPELKNLKNWIVKDDYNKRKPDSECFQLALNKFYKDEKYIVGIENTIAGYNALKYITDIIYIYENNNKHLFINLDAFIFNNYLQLFQNQLL